MDKKTIVFLSSLIKNVVEDEDSDTSDDEAIDEGMLVLLLADTESKLQKNNLVSIVDNNLTNPKRNLRGLAGEKHKKVAKYSEINVNEMTDTKFQEHFRLTRQSYLVLEKIVHGAEMTKNFFPYDTSVTGTQQFKTNCKGEKEPISCSKCLQITLWYLGNMCSMRDLADRFGTAKSTVYSAVHRICLILTELMPTFVIWPTSSEDLAKTKDGFYEKSSIPGCIGAVDGCHIPILCQDKEQQKAYCNRKGFHSMLLQGTCNAEKIFTNVFIGYPGSCHDARVFKASSVFENIATAPSEYFPSPEYHVLGDSAYPLSEYMLTPYRDTGSMTPVQRKYNKQHSRARICIEHAYGLLKGRWRKLRHVECKLEFIPYIISACCVLHNICQIYEDKFEEWYDSNTDASYNRSGMPSVVSLVPGNSSARAQSKRNTIAASL